MDKSGWIVVPCLSWLFLTACASVAPKGGQRDAELSKKKVANKGTASVGPPVDCAALFIPVTDEDQDRDESECAPPRSQDLTSYPKGHTCKLQVGYVHPTQPAVGMTAANCKRDKLVVKSEKKLDKYLSKGKRVVPTVIGPDGNYYITDHHHLATAVYKTLQERPEEQADIRLYAEIVGNLYVDPSQPPSDPQMLYFWEKQMQGCNNAFLYYLQKRVNPLKPQQMPTALSGMKDDPYRTLSRWVRDANGYIKPEVHPANFLEFLWGDQIRDDLGVAVTFCDFGQRVESRPCQEQIRQLRGILDPAMASARAYSSIDWIEDGGCASNLEGNPEALISCGYNPAIIDVDVDKYITVDRGCETPDQYVWEAVMGSRLPGDNLLWYQYAQGHLTTSYPICRVPGEGDDEFYAGVFDSGMCSYVDNDDQMKESADFDGLTGVQGMYLWSAYTEGDDDFFDDAIPVGTGGSDLGETYVCAAGERIGWVKKGKKKCHLSEDGLHLPFWVLVES